MVSKNALFFRQLGPAQGTGAALGRGGVAVGVSAWPQWGPKSQNWDPLASDS